MRIVDNHSPELVDCLNDLELGEWECPTDFVLWEVEHMARRRFGVYGVRVWVEWDVRIIDVAIAMLWYIKTQKNLERYLVLIRKNCLKDYFNSKIFVCLLIRFSTGRTRGKRGLTGPRISDAWALGKSSRRSDAGKQITPGVAEGGKGGLIRDAHVRGIDCWWTHLDEFLKLLAESQPWLRAYPGQHLCQVDVHCHLRHTRLRSILRMWGSDRRIVSTCHASILHDKVIGNLKKVSVVDYHSQSPWTLQSTWTQGCIQDL